MYDLIKRKNTFKRDKHQLINQTGKSKSFYYRGRAADSLTGCSQAREGIVPLCSALGTVLGTTTAEGSKAVGEHPKERHKDAEGLRGGSCMRNS